MGTQTGSAHAQTITRIKILMGVYLRRAHAPSPLSNRVNKPECKQFGAGQNINTRASLLGRHNSKPSAGGNRFVRIFPRYSGSLVGP